MLLHDARRAARVVDATASWCCWRSRTARAGTGGRSRRAWRCVERGAALRRAGPYQLQAAIAALHAEAARAAETDWPQIAALYAVLAALRAVAGGRAEPRRRRRDGDGSERPACAARRARRRRSARGLPPVARGARRPAAPARPLAQAAAAYRAALALPATTSIARSWSDGWPKSAPTTPPALRRRSDLARHEWPHDPPSPACGRGAGGRGAVSGACIGTLVASAL